MQSTANTQSLVSYDELVSLDGHVRVVFENRSAWNGQLMHAGDGSLLRWVDLKKGPGNDRDFLLDADDDGNVICTTKPAWGRMTTAKVRKI